MTIKMQFLETTLSSQLNQTKNLTCLSINSDNQFDKIKNKKNFTVAVRIKPEFAAHPSQLINLSVKKLSKTSEELKLSFDGKRFDYSSYGQSNDKKFIFDKVFKTEDQNQTIFSELIEEKLHLLQKGVNLSIMAYGATNSGKTYTIFGKKQQEYGKQQVYGISFMTFKKVFEMFRNQFQVTFSFVQIYNENVYDLLSQQNVTTPLCVMQDSEGNTNVIGLNKIQITSASQLQSLIHEGNNARISSSNTHNIYSSRSHAFMELELRHKITRQRTKIVIVDLAGSQKYIYNSLVSNSSSSILKEGSNINKSLLSLGNCIKSLYENDQHIPYRDSKLTRLLKENLSGYAHNIMIACINKKISSFEENLNSLNYASKAIKIEKEIVRKVQSQELSEYQCTFCQEKLPYALVKEINKHEDHKKRVKTRQSQSLSVSPISKNGKDLFPFKSTFSPSLKSSYGKFQKLIDESFQNLINQIKTKASSPEELALILLQAKRNLKTQIKDKVFNSKCKNPQYQELSNKSVVVSQFESSLLNCPESQSQNITSRSKLPGQKKVKISLSKPKKQLQNTASTSIGKFNSDRSLSITEFERPKEYYSTKDAIKIEDDQNQSPLHSFRANLRVEVLDDKDKILDERRKVLEQTSINQRRNSAQICNKIKFKSRSTKLKDRNIQNFISQGDSAKINFLDHIHDNNFIRIQESVRPEMTEIQPFEEFIINNRLLDSTSIAPRMKRDEEELGMWKNIFIKNVESPLGHVESSGFEESFVEERVRASDHKQNMFRAFKCL